MEKKTFPCTKEGMIAAQAFLEEWCPEPKPGIIMDEVVSNIVRCSGARNFSIMLDRGAEGLAMTFVDDGGPFDPTSDIPPPDINASAQDRTIGGLGFFMVKKMSKSVEYRREDDRNILSVVI